ncbi:MAG: phosphatidate cytidylyltransferase [Flavobacteriales bacterium]
MLKRAITGLIFVIVLIICTYLHPVSLFGLYLFFVIVGSWEYLNILNVNSKISPNLPLGIFNAAIAFLAITSEQILGLSSTTFIAVLLLGIFAIPLIELYNKKEEPFSNIAHSLFPILYVALPFGLLIYANGEFPNYLEEYSAELILGFYFILWSNDTGAYLSGKAFGKHKLFERISPNKTWQGSIGGGILAIGISVLMSIIFNCMPIWQWIAIGVIISIFGSMGDLAQSMFKRSMGVKDSGKIMPGHGGILDRFDGLLIASPFVFAFLILVN